jgi:hypothetical protein
MPQSGADPIADFVMGFHSRAAEISQAPEAFSQLIRQIARQEAASLLQEQAAQTERNRLIDSQEGSLMLGLKETHLRRLRRENKIKGVRAEGTRRFYFRLGDLLDWKAANTRLDDGGLKHSRRDSARKQGN